jgi:uncharacterized membrane protein (UPF0136 family)
VAYLIAVIAGLAFGMADQYLGSLSSELGGWAAAVSQLAAPWFALPFLAGMTQERPRRAMAVGLLVTVAGLLGYFVRTCSPVESIPLEEFPTCFSHLVRAPYNPVWIAGGLVAGPPFGYLGHRWRVDRWWVGAAAATGAFCLEPLARTVVGILLAPPVVWVTEIVIGVVVGAYFAVAIVISRRSRVPSLTRDQH